MGGGGTALDNLPLVELLQLAVVSNLLEGGKPGGQVGFGGGG